LRGREEEHLKKNNKCRTNGEICAKKKKFKKGIE